MAVTAMSGPRVTRRRTLGREIARHWVDYLFISPFFFTFAIFKLYPLIWAFHLSSSQWRGFGPMVWVEFENYRYVISFIQQSLVNTLQFTYILLPTGIMLSIVLTVFLNMRSLSGRSIFRTICFLPYVTSSVIVAIVFTQLFDYQMGWVNCGLLALLAAGMGLCVWHLLDAPIYRVDNPRRNVGGCAHRRSIAVRFVLAHCPAVDCAGDGCAGDPVFCRRL